MVGDGRDCINRHLLAVQLDGFYDIRMQSR